MLITDVRVATMAPGNAPYGLIDNGAIAIAGGMIRWVGRSEDCPAGLASLPGARWRTAITPALIDCHTHVVHGGHRAREFEMRLNGASYEDIAKAGGGIASTVTATGQRQRKRCWRRP